MKKLMMLAGMMTGLAAWGAEPLTYVALFRVEAANMDAFLAAGKEYVPVLDKLMNDGVLTAYGMDQDILHHPTRLNVAFWYTTANYANLEKVEKEIEAFQAKSPALMKKTAALTDMTKHTDIIVRSIEGNWSKAASCKTPVSLFSQNTIRPGKQSEYLEAYRKYQKPVLEKLVANGAICAYQLDVEDMHTMGPGVSWSIILAPNLAAADAVNAAYEDAGRLLSASERSIRRSTMEALVDQSKHEDTMSRAVVFKAK
jgi:hypothetical protein